MTTEEIIEGNKLIAEFMGETIVDRNGEYAILHAPYAMKTYLRIWATHSKDWNKLIKLIEKIESTHDEFHGYFGVHIHSNGCTIQGTNLRTNPENFHPAYFNEVYANTKLEATYICVVQFLTWFNNDQKNKRPEDKKNSNSKNINQ